MSAEENKGSPAGEKLASPTSAAASAQQPQPAAASVAAAPSLPELALQLAQLAASNPGALQLLQQTLQQVAVQQSPGSIYAAPSSAASVAAPSLGPLSALSLPLQPQKNPSAPPPGLLILLRFID